jgi:hypothetical protein
VVMQFAPHCLAIHAGHRCFRGGPCRCKVKRMTGQTAFTDECTRAKHPDDPFLSLFRQHDEFDAARLDIENRVAFGALPEYAVLGLVDRDGSAAPTVVRNASASKCWGETILPLPSLAARLFFFFLNVALLSGRHSELLRVMACVGECRPGFWNCPMLHSREDLSALRCGHQY